MKLFYLIYKKTIKLTGTLLEVGIEIVDMKLDIKSVQTKIVWAFLIPSIETIILEGTQPINLNDLLLRYSGCDEIAFVNQYDSDCSLMIKHQTTIRSLEKSP